MNPDQKSRPATVTAAVYLYSAGLFLGLLVNVFDAVRIAMAQGLAVAGTALWETRGLFMGYGFCAVILFFIWRRKNWARITLLVFFLLGLLTLFVSYNRGIEGWDPLFFGIFLVRRLLVVATQICLFLPSSNQWFRLRSKELSPQAGPTYDY